MQLLIIMSIDDPVWREQLVAASLDWFDVQARDLPWRRLEDPYATWVSEIMLQQTQVATVIDYFERWMQTFPDVDSLADAQIDDVLKMWEGLGYYRRARYLHRGARLVRDEFGGEVPGTLAELRKIPGVGPYTAGAIASIAFGQAVPTVDGNVIRVLARLLALDIQPKDSADVRQVWSLAEQLVPQERPGDFNQALMELGATVCTPKTPSCPQCPVRFACAGFATGSPTDYPQVSTRAKVRTMTARAGVIVDGEGRVLVERRPDAGLLAGLWQFPAVDDTESAGELDEHLRNAGVQAMRGEVIAEVSHRFSHIEMSIFVHRYDHISACELPESWRWASADELGSIALSRAMRKVEEKVQSHLG